MRSLAVTLLLCSAARLCAQEQEGKLMNRILRPDMTLANDAQNGNSLPPAMPRLISTLTLSTFYLQQKPGPGSPIPTRASIPPGSSRSTATTEVKPASSSLLAARSSSANRTYDTPSARVSVDLRDAHRTAARADSAFAGNRPFLDKGQGPEIARSKKQADEHRRYPGPTEQEQVDSGRCPYNR